jgi:hypothetical protein
MSINTNSVSRRRFIQASAGIGAIAATSIAGIGAARAAPIERRLSQA